MKSSILLQILLIGSLLAFATPGYVFHASATLSYVAGVKSGDNVTYGNVTAFWQSNSTISPPPFITEFLHVQSVHVSVLSASGSNVSAIQTFNFNNGTAARNFPLRGSVADGSGNLTFWILASGLTAGDPIYNIPSPRINRTDTELFGGAPRQVIRLSFVANGGNIQQNWAWDQATGVLVSFESNFFLQIGSSASFGYSNATITSTSLWSSSSTAPYVIGTSPVLGVPVDSTISATFSKVMDPATITTSTFAIKQGVTSVPGTVTYAGTTASFKPSSNLALNTNYIATITTGAKDLAGNALKSNFVWTFGTQSTGSCAQAPVDLRSATNFAVLGASGVSNTGNTIVTGDLGLSPGSSITGFPPGIVIGTIHQTDPAAAQAQSDTTTAYNDAVGRTLCVIAVSGNLGGQTLASGLYKSQSSLDISSGDLTLDAQGSPNAVFIFQIATSLTTTSGRQVFLAGGAQAKNIFWVVGSSATLGTSSVLYGTILARASITLTNSATLNGRALAQIGAVALDSSTVTLPVNSLTVGDFGISANPTSLTIRKAGINDPFAIAVSTVALTSLNSFSGNIALGASTSGFLTATFQPSSMVNLAANSSANTSLVVSGANSSPGTYFVTVTGTSGSISHSVTLTVQVVIPPDFQIFVSTPPGGNIVLAGGTTSVGVQLFSNGLSNFNGTVTLTGHVSPTVAQGPTLSFNPTQISFTLPGTSFSQLTISTTPLTPPGNYTVTITGTSGTLVRTFQLQLTVLPPPVLRLSPSSGPVGTQVTVHGSGFLNPSQGQFSFPIELQMTFDDQLVGLFLIRGSSFNFTFNVPDAQAGIVHQVHAKELFPSNLDVQASFLVLPEPSALSVSVSVGTIYFPGDTATIFALTSVTGQPTTVSSLQIVLVRPNGSNITLKVVLVSPGVYKASYAVPAAGSMGTYAVIIKAHQTSSAAGSALASFEVKPTWLQSNGRNVITATSLVGAVGALGVVAFAWRKGHFNRRKDEFPIP